MAYANIDDLFGTTSLEEDVELSVGTVKVRGLSRMELMLNAKNAQTSPHETEIKNVALCLVEPKLTEDQVAKWYALPGSVADFGKLSDAIQRLSGFGDRQAKRNLPAAGTD